jgi:hypothetical protein
LAHWNWKVVREFVAQRFERTLCRSSCLNSRHRLGFVLWSCPDSVESVALGQEE